MDQDEVYIPGADDLKGLHSGSVTYLYYYYSIARTYVKMNLRVFSVGSCHGTDKVSPS